MKRPTKIKVACFDINIIDFTSHEASLLARFGEFSALENHIKLDPAINKIKEVDTLLHELNHAIYWAYGIDDEDKEERIVGTFATAWTQIFRDNPELLEFIKHNLETKRKRVQIKGIKKAN